MNGKALKIILVVTQLESGGAQAAAVRLAQSFRERGHDAETWFLYKKTDAYAGHPKIWSITPSAPGTPFKVIGLLWKFFHALRASQADVVISFTHYANIICQPVAALAGVPIRIASQRNPYESYPMLAKIVDKVCGVTPIYTANTAVSQSVADSFFAHGQSYNAKLRVIVNGLPTRGVVATSDTLRRDFGIPDEVFLVASIGRLQPQKNQSVLVRALVSAPNVHLLIAGEGPLRSELMELAATLGVKDRLHLPGELTRETIQTLLQVADCYAMPSAFEGMSNALLEAVQAGQAIVASDIPAQKEVLLAYGEPAAGILLPSGDVGAWSNALVRLKQQSSLAKMLRMRALEVSGEFTIERAASRYLDLISGLRGRRIHADI